MITYDDVVSYIEGIPMFTKKHTLDHTRNFLKWLGNPEAGQKIIHVAGTNGKGSVCAYLQAMMMAEGKNVGFFTSPHLMKINERIKFNGLEIDDETFVKVFCIVKNIVDEMGEQGIAHPSYFEFLFGMGMIAFKELNPDYIIMETGLGGRLDATNAVAHPVATVITSISLDHTQYLGDTVEKVAMEKAGIIKAGAYLVYDNSNESAGAVIKAQAEKKQVSYTSISKRDVLIQKITDKKIAFSRANAYDDNTVWKLSNSGLYQTMNASIAIATMEHVEGVVSKEKYELWNAALEKVTWEGRMEEVMAGVYLDGAHNPGAIEAFCDSLEARDEMGKEAKLPVILFSAVADKKFDDMIEELCRRVPAKAYIVTEIKDTRKVSADRLKETFEQYTDAPVYAESSLPDAWKLAIREKEEQGKLYCLGSLYLIGMIKNMLEDMKSSDQEQEG